MADGMKMKDTYRSVCYHSLVPAKPATITDSDRQKKLFQRIEENRLRSQNAMKICKENDSVLKNDQANSNSVESRNKGFLGSEQDQEEKGPERSTSRERSTEVTNGSRPSKGQLKSTSRERSEVTNGSRPLNGHDLENDFATHIIQEDTDGPFHCTSESTFSQNATEQSHRSRNSLVPEEKDRLKRRSSRSRERQGVTDQSTRPMPAPRISRSTSDPGGGRDSYSGVVRSISQGSEGHESAEWKTELANLQEEVYFFFFLNFYFS